MEKEASYLDAALAKRANGEWDSVGILLADASDPVPMENSMGYDIQEAIPHRGAFLFLDEILEVSAEHVTAEYTPRLDHPLWALVYAGHYPGSPITPGVLLCEMVFQASAVMVREVLRGEPAAGVPVVTRIGQVKFKNMVQPGQKLILDVILKERLANAFFMKGTIKANGKPVLQAEFAVALAESEPTKQ